MSDDAELELFRHSVNCAALLEQIRGGWKLDQRESTRRALKYRDGPDRSSSSTMTAGAGGIRPAAPRETSSTLFNTCSRD